MTGARPELSRVLVAGATGHLGQLVVEELVARGATVRAMARPGKAAQLSGRRNVEIVVAELDDGDSLDRAVEGVDSVVSCVQGGPEVIVDGQLRLLERARRHGVARFLPSDFSFDLFNLPEGSNINSDWRRRFARRAAEVTSSTTELVHVLNGCFLDLGVLFGFLGAFDLRAGTMALWGEGHVPMDFTTYRDTARYTAIAATARDVPQRFAVAGDTLTFWELKSAVETASGRRLRAQRRGSLDELSQLIEERVTAAPERVYDYLPLMYWRAMLNGDGRLRDTQQHRHPEVRPVTVAAYVAAHREAFRPPA